MGASERCQISLNPPKTTRYRAREQSPMGTVPGDDCENCADGKLVWTKLHGGGWVECDHCGWIPENDGD